MFDNGLLKHYKQGLSAGGFLNATELGINWHVTNMRKNAQVTIDGKQYYIKAPSKITETIKSKQDAEILLSQIYSRIGLKSAIYLPAQNKHGTFLISNDVKTPTTELAADYLFPRLEKTGLEALPLFGQFENSRMQRAKDRLVSQIYTPQAIYEQTKMRVADIASYNQDRHYLNFFYSLKHPVSDSQTEGSFILQHFRSYFPNRVNGVVCIDYEDSGSILHEMINGNPYADFLSIYENDFDDAAMPREDVLDNLSTNEEFAQTINKQQLAEEIGSADPESVASDIKETCDYEIDPRIVNTLTRSFNEVAEELLK